MHEIDSQRVACTKHFEKFLHRIEQSIPWLNLLTSLVTVKIVFFFAEAVNNRLFMLPIVTGINILRSQIFATNRTKHTRA
jgi:hypothetical protein